MAQVAIDRDKENKKAVNKLIDILLSIFGFVLIFLTAKEYLNNFDEFSNSKTLYDFFVPTFYLSWLFHIFICFLFL